MVFCELTSLLALSTCRDTQSSTLKSRKTLSASKSSQDTLRARLLRVSEYVIQLLRGEVCPASPLRRPLAPAAYVTLLPTIWALLSGPTTSPNTSTPIFQAIIEHAIGVSSKSALKKPTIEFVARLVLVRVFLCLVGQLYSYSSSLTQSASI